MSKTLAAATKQYAVRGGTVPRSIPEGRVLCHNHVQHEPWTICGTNGFRGFTTIAKPPAGFVKCPCTWSGLPHYAHRDHVAHYRKDGRLKATGEFGRSAGRVVEIHSKPTRGMNLRPAPH